MWNWLCLRKPIASIVVIRSSIRAGLLMVMIRKNPYLRWFAILISCSQKERSLLTLITLPSWLVVSQQLGLQKVQSVFTKKTIAWFTPWWKSRHTTTQPPLHPFLALLLAQVARFVMRALPVLVVDLRLGSLALPYPIWIFPGQTCLGSLRNMASLSALLHHSKLWLMAHSVVLHSTTNLVDPS